MTFEEEDDPICSTCSGSGEGQHEGSRCWACKGRGVVFLNEPDDDDNADAAYELQRERELEAEYGGG